ncbi:unnamed protein product [Cyprideis torosa]|uniref:Uncharacterized protein n=1 Tax=Cyprideis torosa TaxID=163714 RepID=A0A7R8W9V8_9CRUS|nr:unnamed protein product [Cyprideis torosa]CAG0885743.1 unnamed protein product [Cyprideis torosa]
MIWWTLFVLVLAWFLKRTFFDPLKFWDQFGVKTKPGALPIVGHLWGIWKKHVFKEDLEDIQKLGKIFGIYEGNRPILVVADREIIKELMITRFDQFTDRRDFLEPEPKYRRKILFLLHGQEWRIMRNVSSPFFSTGKIKQMSQVMTSCVDEVMQRIMTMAKEKGHTEVELKFTTMTLTIDVILRCVYGIAVPDLENPDSELIVQAKKAFATDELSSPFVMILLLYPGLVAKVLSFFPSMLGMESLRFFIHMGEKVMKQRESKGQLGNEFMDLLLKAQRQEKTTGTLEKHATNTTGGITEPVMTEEMIVAQCIQFLLAGFETTSSLLTTAMYSLTINPELQEKLFQELTEKTKGGEKPIEHETLAECEYLDHVIKESLRLYPPVVRVERRAVTDTKLGDVLTPKLLRFAIATMLHRAVVPLLAVFVVTCGQGVNRAPFFIQNHDMEKFSLREDTPVGSIVYTLEGSDPEGEELHYSISSDYFSVDRRSGVVTLVEPLDRETEDMIEVIISITDSPGGNVVSLRREVAIRDVNDFVPKFLDLPYVVTIPEDTSLGSVVFNVHRAASSDGKYTGYIALKKTLDYESRTSYTLPLLVQDQSPSRPLSAVASVLILVSDVQDQPPLFFNSPYSIVLSEGTPADSTVLSFRVGDGDFGAPRPLQVSITSDPLSHFDLVSLGTRGENEVMTMALVTKGKGLDRENPLILRKGGLYILELTAAEVNPRTGQPFRDDPRAVTTTQVTVVVQDVDDQVPHFNIEEAVLRVTEDIVRGAALPGLNLIAMDEDSRENAQFHLELLDPRNSQHPVFEVDPKQGTGTTPVSIRVMDPSQLDYEKNPGDFEFEVVAYRGGEGSIPSDAARCRIRVVIQDANDNRPQFQWEHFKVLISEKLKPGDSIDILNATDRDHGVFGQIRYSLRGFGSERFHVDPLTGEISVADCGHGRCLDAEREREYSLAFEATDGGGLSSVLNLNIQRRIPEGATELVPPLRVLATDADVTKEDNGRVRYSIVSDPTEGAVQIDPSTGEVTLTRALHSNESETGRFRILLLAQDGGNPALADKATLHLTVGRDDNDRPIFLGTPYETSVYEDAPGETTLLRVSAHDPDGDDASIRFQLASAIGVLDEGEEQTTSSTLDSFRLNRNTGVLSLAPSNGLLDRDKFGTKHSIVVVAIDGENPPQTASTTVTQLHVLDVNDKPPSFVERNYVAYVQETADPGTPFLTLAATDPDLSSSRSRIPISVPFVLYAQS